MERYRNCVMCRRGLHRGRYRVRILTENLPRTHADLAAFIQQNAALEVVFDNTRRVCYRCWQRAETAVRAQQQQQEPEPQIQQRSEPQPQQNGVIQVPDYNRAPNTPVHCIFRGCRNETRHRIPNVVKIHLLCEHKLYIPDGARACREHLDSNVWDDLPQSCNISHEFTAEYLSNIFDILRDAVKHKSTLNFEEVGGMSEEEMHYWTGRSTEQFNTILEQTPSLRERCAAPRTALGILLTKLRTGEPDERLATLFKMSRRKLERILAVVRECLENENE